MSISFTGLIRAHSGGGGGQTNTWDTEGTTWAPTWDPGGTTFETTPKPPRKHHENTTTFDPEETTMATADESNNDHTVIGQINDTPQPVLRDFQTHWRYRVHIVISDSNPSNEVTITIQPSGYEIGKNELFGPITTIIGRVNENGVFSSTQPKHAGVTKRMAIGLIPAVPVGTKIVYSVIKLTDKVQNSDSITLKGTSWAEGQFGSGASGLIKSVEKTWEIEVKNNNF